MLLQLEATSIFQYDRHSPVVNQLRLENFGMPYAKQKQIATVCNSVTRLFKKKVLSLLEHSKQSWEVFYLVESLVKTSVNTIECFTNMPTRAVC